MGARSRSLSQAGRFSRLHIRAQRSEKNERAKTAGQTGKWDEKGHSPDWHSSPTRFPHQVVDPREFRSMDAQTAFRQPESWNGSPLTLARFCKSPGLEPWSLACNVAWDKYLCLCRCLVISSRCNFNVRVFRPFRNLSMAGLCLVKKSQIPFHCEKGAAHSACRCFGPSLLQASLGGFSACRAPSRFSLGVVADGAPESSFDAHLTRLRQTQRHPVQPSDGALHLPPPPVDPSIGTAAP